MSKITVDLRLGDCQDVMSRMTDNSVDLVFCSPPYADRRAYGIDFNLRGRDWVDWAYDRYLSCLRVCRGLVAWVVEGTGPQSANYGGEPVLLLAKLIEAGIPVWKPGIYGRYSLPGKFSVLRNNWEFIICSSGHKKLEWSDPTAMGTPPKCKPGGRTRPRKTDGSRNVATQDYKQPERTNYGNILWCGAVGGGQMGHALAHANEAPFPEFLPEVYVQSFCKPGGTVLDCFAGSGTTLVAAARAGRNAVGIELRADQLTVAAQRLQSSSLDLSNITIGVSK